MAFYTIGAIFRSYGDRFHKFADALQLRPIGLVNKRCGHRRVIILGDRKPIINQGSWIAPTASVIGSVLLGVKSTVWYGAVVRADIHHVKIGVMSHICDRSVIHVTAGEISGGKPHGTYIGSNVVIEPGCVIHAATIEDGALIGSGSVVLDGAVVEKEAQIGPGSLIPAGKRIPARQLWSGNPIAFERVLTDEDVSKVVKTSEDFHTLSKAHDEETMKSEYEILTERETAFMHESAWWGQPIVKRGSAYEHPTIRKLIEKTRQEPLPPDMQPQEKRTLH